MAEVADTVEVLWEHPVPWLFVIIPVQNRHMQGGSTSKDVPETFPLFAAFCKRCNTYYTQPLAFNNFGARNGHVDLPKYGCAGPEVP